MLVVKKLDYTHTRYRTNG